MEIIGTTIALGDVAVRLAMFGAAIKNAPQVWYEYSATLHNIVNTSNLINEMIGHFPPKDKKNITSSIQKRFHDQLRLCNKDLVRVYKDAKGLLKRFERLERRPERKKRKVEVGQWIFTMSRRVGFIIKERVIQAQFETITHAKASMHLLVSLIGLSSVHTGNERIENSINRLSEEINEHHEEMKSRRTRGRRERPIKLYFFDERRVKPMVKRRRRRRRSRHEQSQDRSTEGGINQGNNRNNAASQADTGLEDDTHSTAQPTDADPYDPYGTCQALDLYPWFGQGQNTRSSGSILLLEASTEYEESVNSLSSEEADGYSTVSIDSNLSNQSTSSSAVYRLLSLELLIRSQPLVKLNGSASEGCGLWQHTFCVKSLLPQGGPYEFTVEAQCTAQPCDHAKIRDIKDVIHQLGLRSLIARITKFTPTESNSSNRVFATPEQDCHGECSHTHLVGFSSFRCISPLYDIDIVVESAIAQQHETYTEGIPAELPMRIPPVTCVYCMPKPHPAALIRTRSSPPFSSGRIFVFECGQCGIEIWLWY